MSSIVSIIIPTYNRAHLIKRSIDSILNQTYQNFEVIIVDDGSTDNTKDVVEDINDERIKYFKHKKNMGQSAARNTGIRASKGDWVAFQDSDDEWLETKLEKQMKAADALSDEYGVIHCGIQFVDVNSKQELTKWIVKTNINKEIYNNIGNGPGTPTMVIRRKIFDETGFFDESLPSHEESELSLRIAQKYKYQLIDEYLVVSYKNHNQITSNNDLFVKAEELILEKHKEILNKKLVSKFSIIIASDSIVKGDFIKAKRYLLLALKNNIFRLKTILSYISLLIFPNKTQSVYKNKYKKRGLI